MPTKELRELMHAYQHAYNSYTGSLEAYSEATAHGEWPPQEVVDREEKALNALNYGRQRLLDALFTYSRRRPRGNE